METLLVGLLIYVGVLSLVVWDFRKANLPLEIKHLRERINDLQLTHCDACKAPVFLNLAKRTEIHYQYLDNCRNRDVKYWCSHHAPDYDVELRSSDYSRPTVFYKKVEAHFERVKRKESELT